MNYWRLVDGCSLTKRSFFNGNLCLQPFRAFTAFTRHSPHFEVLRVSPCTSKNQLASDHRDAYFSGSARVSGGTCRINHYRVMKKRFSIQYNPLLQEESPNSEAQIGVGSADVEKNIGGVSAVEIRLRKGKRELEILFQPGEERIRLSAEFLRVESPSAEVQGHSSSEKRLIYAKKFVEIKEIEPVGNYAVRLIFSDGHNTGLYSWKYLYELGKNKYTLQKRYILSLREANRSRYPKKYQKP